MPVTFESRRVWVGQISRDIGVRVTPDTWNLTTHNIAPDVDFDRITCFKTFLYQVVSINSVHVEGVVPAPISAPRSNLTGDVYFTDGRRLVIFLSVRPKKNADIASIKRVWRN